MSSLADDIEEEMGPAEPRKKRQSQQARKSGGPSMFDLANDVDTLRVLDRLGAVFESTPRGDMVDCLGCGEPGALVCESETSGKPCGVRCMHNRCAKAGPPGHPGFRGNVDLVANRENLKPTEAAELICEWFGIDLPKREARPVPEPPPGLFDDDEPIGEDPSGARGGEQESPGAGQSKPGAKRPASIEEVIAGWRQAGPLIHEPTGIAALDEHTGGGPVYGSRWYLNGAPDAGKTALIVQLGHLWLARGIAVGLLAVDEEAGDIVTRLAQRIGYARHHCETRDGAVLSEMAEGLAGLPLRLYDDRWSIEAAAVDLADFAKIRADADPTGHPHGPRAAFLIDSIQTVSCAANLVATANGKEPSEVTAITANVRAIRAAATRHRFIAIATSEFGRGAYRSSDPKQQTSTMASGKWSGAIEYSARVLLGLRSVAEEKDLIELEIAKNKHGPRDVKMHLRIDRRSQTLTETVYDAPPEASPGDRRATAAKERVVADAVTVVVILTRTPGLTVRGLRAAVKLATGAHHDRVTDAVALLGDAITKEDGARNAVLLSVVTERLPEAVRVAWDGSK